MTGKLRQNVLGVILDYQDNVLLVARAHDPFHWQFPQGGVNDGEDPDYAIFRELKEEVGTHSFSIIQVCPEKHVYHWSRNLIRDEHIGQEQTIYLLRFHGSTDEIRVDGRELGGSLWLPPYKVDVFLHDYRKPVWEMIKKHYQIPTLQEKNNHS